VFLAHGLRVTICDPRPDIGRRVRAGLREIAPTLAQLDLPLGSLGDDSAALRFDPVVATAVATADVVRENGPEQLAVKQQLWAEIERGVISCTCCGSAGRCTRRTGPVCRSAAA